MRKLIGALTALAFTAATLIQPALAQQLPTGGVKIDQTTPGTTNGVVINSSALPTGAATQATLATLNGNTPAIGTQTKAASRSTTPASDLGNLEPAGAPITGSAMPAGGTGLTGWLSAIWSGNVSRNLYSAQKTTNLAASGLIGTSYLALGASPSPYTSVVGTFYSNTAGATYVVEVSDGTGSYAVVQTGTLAANTQVTAKLPASAMAATGTQYRAYIQNSTNAASLAYVSIALATN